MTLRASQQPVYRENAEVVSVSALPGAHCRMQLHAPQIATAIRPGQFVNISPPLGTALLRRPLGVAIVGVLLGLVYQRSKSITPCLLIHLLYNLLSIAVMKMVT